MKFSDIKEEMQKLNKALKLETSNRKGLRRENGCLITKGEVL